MKTTLRHQTVGNDSVYGAINTFTAPSNPHKASCIYSQGCLVEQLSIQAFMFWFFQMAVLFNGTKKLLRLFVDAGLAIPATLTILTVTAR